MQSSVQQNGTLRLPLPLYFWHVPAGARGKSSDLVCKLCSASRSSVALLGKRCSRRWSSVDQKGTLLLYTGPPRFLLPLGRNPKAELMVCYLLSLTTLPRSGSGPPCLAGDRLRIRLPRLRWRSQRMETPLPPKSRSSRSANQSRHVAELLRCRVWQRQLMAGGLGTVPSGWRLATSGQGPVDGMADGKCRHREAAWVHAAWQL